MKMLQARCEIPPPVARRVPANPVPVVEAPTLIELLSGREEEIAILAARGLANKQIGQRLGISPWTVATHLRRTFLKLEITRRSELCAVVSLMSV